MELLQPNRISRLRRLVQAGFFLFILFAGWRFYLFFLWASGRSADFVTRSPAIEGFLPIGALVSLKRLILTGNYDTIHPAGLTIFLAALAIGFFFRKGFCAWICPIGFVSNLAEAVGKKLRVLVTPPVWLDYPLLSLKFLLLAFFTYIILWKMDLQAIEGFIATPYNLVVDAKMLLFFLEPSFLSLWIMIFLVAVSFFIRNFWCRYLCPYGALLGVLAFFGPVYVRRKPENCIDCHKCNRICPAAIKVSEKTTVRSPECIGCLECVAVCPQKECLNLTAVGSKNLPLITLPVAVVGLFLAFWLVAVLSGHWQSNAPPELLKALYMSDLKAVAHP